MTKENKAFSEENKMTHTVREQSPDREEDGQGGRDGEGEERRGEEGGEGEKG